jgi:hypothetical protein
MPISTPTAAPDSTAAGSLGNGMQSDNSIVQPKHLVKPIPEDTKTFTDVGDSYWAHYYIRYLAGCGIIDGYLQPDGLFKYEPENEIKRSEIIKLIAATLELPLDEDYDGSVFADWEVVENWAKPYIGALVKLGIVRGSLENGQLLIKADNNITRQEMAAMAVRALKIEVPEGEESRRFISDLEEVADWAKDVMIFAINNDMINIDGNSANPLNNAKRSEAAMILYGLLEFKS